MSKNSTGYTVLHYIQQAVIATLGFFFLAAALVRGLLSVLRGPARLSAYDGRFDDSYAPGATANAVEYLTHAVQDLAGMTGSTAAEWFIAFLLACILLRLNRLPDTLPGDARGKTIRPVQATAR